MAAKEPAKPEQQAARRYRRRDTSLRARYSADGTRYHRAIATSIGADGAFLRSEVLFPAGTRVLLEVPLGGSIEPLRAVAKVVYLNRRSGTEVVAGLGVQLVDPSDELRRRIERFMDGYPGPVAMDLEGRVSWPFGRDRDGQDALDLGLRLLEPDATGDAWRPPT